MKKYDYLIVGAGFAGSIVARELAEKNKHVLIIDKRSHIAGNAYDYINEAGVLVHKYGPHYFRTDNQEVFDYLSRFTLWYDHEYHVKVRIANKLYSFPININTLEQFFNKKLDEQKAVKLLNDLKDKNIDIPANAEEQVLKNIGRELYEAFFKGYTEKQWGKKASELDASVAARIPIRTNRDEKYVSDKIQKMPLGGYTEMFKKILDHPNIDIRLNKKFDNADRQLATKIIWTGCIDEYYNYKFGKLEYRSLDFSFVNFYNLEYVQECEQINYPDFNVPYTRIVEIKHATGQKLPNTTISIEYPKSKGDPYYPIPDKKNFDLYQKYYNLSMQEKNIYFIGRLAQYKYLNMDQVVNEALNFVKGLIK